MQAVIHTFKYKGKVIQLIKNEYVLDSTCGRCVFYRTECNEQNLVSCNRWILKLLPKSKYKEDLCRCSYFSLVLGDSLYFKSLIRYINLPSQETSKP